MHASLTADEVRQRFGPAGRHLLYADRTSAETLGMAVRHADSRFELWRYHLQRRPY